MAKKRPRRDAKKLSIDVVEARQIVLVDEYGKERMNFMCSGGDGDKGGSTVIHINDGAGRPCLTIQVDDDRREANIILFNSNNSTGVALGVNAERGNGLYVANVEGKSSLMLNAPGPASLDPRGSHPNITIFDSASGRMWSTFEGEPPSP